MIWKIGLRIYNTLGKCPTLSNLGLTEEIMIINLSISPFDSVDFFFFCFLYFEVMLLYTYKFPGGLTHFSL